MKRIVLTTMVTLVFLSACSSSTSSVPVGPPVGSQGGIEIYQPSVRLPGDGMAGMASATGQLAGYMLIKNTGTTPDSLVGVQADFTDMTMLHMSSVDSNNVSSMIVVNAIDIPAGQTVELKPGGYHIMFVGLKRDLKVGDSVTLILQFKNAGAISIPAQVTDK